MATSSRAHDAAVGLVLGAIPGIKHSFNEYAQIELKRLVDGGSAGSSSGSRWLSGAAGTNDDRKLDSSDAATLSGLDLRSMARRLSQYFDTKLPAALKQHEAQYFELMTSAFKRELAQQIESWKGRYEEANSRATSAEALVDTMRSRLSRRTHDFNTERKNWYKTLLTLKELVRDAGIEDENLILAIQQSADMMAAKIAGAMSQVAAKADSQSMLPVLNAKANVSTLASKLKQDSKEVQRLQVCALHH